MPVKISYFKNGIRQVQPTIDIDVLSALEKIKSDEYREQVLQLRETENKQVRQSLKRDLGYFTFSGTFKKRHANQLIKHSNLICIDLDDLDIIHINDQEVERDISQVYEVKEDLKKDPYITAMFVSPSGNGLKLLIQIDGQNHLASFLGLEKYFRETYHLEIDPSGKDVSRACYVSYDPELWLNREAQTFTAVAEKDYQVDYETGEVQERVTDSSQLEGKLRKSYDRAVWVTEQIESKGQDITDDYERWMLIGMSLAVFGEAGRDLFHRVSQFHHEYKPRECDYKFDDFLKNTRFNSPAKFFSVAKEMGYETRKTVQAELATPEDINADFLTWDPPKGCQLSDEMKEETIKYGFIAWRNQYWFASWKDSNKRVTYDSISNYVVRPLFLILSKSEPKRLYEMKNMFGQSAIVDMPAKCMVSPQSFMEVMESQGNFILDIDRKKFLRLRSKWYEEMKNAIEIKTLGWQKDGFYAFSNGIYYDRKFHPIDEYGMIGKTFVNEEGEQDSKFFFIPANSDIYKDEEQEYENEKKFIYVQRETKFKDWSQLFVDTHGDNGKIALMYYVTAIFRDFIYDRFKFFPHLFGFGPPGTGKSTLGWSLSYLFGKERKPFNLNAGTAPGFYRTFAQFRNAIQWFDEYANSIDLKRIQDLKNAYDGAGHVKGDFSAGGNSNKTISTPINSACYISGQELPTADNALFKRCILLQFHKTDYSDEERKRAASLQEMQERALTHLTAAITSLRETVQEAFHEHFDKTIKEFKKALEDKYGSIEERIIHNMVIQVAMFRTLESALPWPYTYEEIKQTAIRMIYEQNKLISRSAETSQFWDTVQFLYNAHAISDTADFTIKTVVNLKLRVDRNETMEKVFEKPTDLMFVSLNKIHGLYMKALREQGEKKGMNKESLVHYLQHSKGYVGAVNKVNYGDRNSSGYVFDYGTIEAMGYDFRKSQAKEEDVTTEEQAFVLPNQNKTETKTDEQGDLPF